MFIGLDLLIQVVKTLGLGLTGFLSTIQIGILEDQTGVIGDVLMYVNSCVCIELLVQSWVMLSENIGFPINS